MFYKKLRKCFNRKIGKNYVEKAKHETDTKQLCS